MQINILDCTFRDGGYYNSWDFPQDIANKYLYAMQCAGVDIVELGFRSTINSGFKGPYAFTTDSYLGSLNIPSGLKVAVMVNASELIHDDSSIETTLRKLFPVPCSDSPVDIVRIACHFHEFERVLPVSCWLKTQGYEVGFNLMQIADRSQEDLSALTAQASQYPLDVLYFADSMGSLDPAKTSRIINWLRGNWKGELGIHTHDNMGLALSNTIQAFKDGVTWLDSTVTGMGRGPGNARTEELVIEISELRQQRINMVPLMNLIRNYFDPLKKRCGWGTNPYYYLAGKYGIHPTYIQEMLGDSRYSEEDILIAIDHLRVEGGKKFSLNNLDASRSSYRQDVKGCWAPRLLMEDKEVFILGAGPGVEAHRGAIEEYIKTKQPVVIALNTQSGIAQELIDLRVACHPVRLLADCETHAVLPQPLITPVSLLPDDVSKSLADKTLLDFGVSIQSKTFCFDETDAVIPNSLVISYALAIANSGKASRILLAGFDGYSSDDPRTKEMQALFELYKNSGGLEIVSVTPTVYNIPIMSIYAM